MPTDLKNITTHPEWVAVQEMLEDQRQRRLKKLVSGTCTDTEYHAIAGEVRGIELVLQTPYRSIQTP